LEKVGSYFIFREIGEREKADHNIWYARKKSLKNLGNPLILGLLWGKMVTEWRKVEQFYHHVV
jgi:hypothetical protein